MFFTHNTFEPLLYYKPTGGVQTNFSVDQNVLYPYGHPHIEVSAFVLSSSLFFNLYHSLHAYSADDKLIFFLFFSENRFWHFMQIIS